MDYREIIDYHRQKEADLTIAFLAVPPAQAANRFGVAQIEAEAEEPGGRVLSYEEKPAFPKGNWASLTIYCFRPQALYEVLESNAADDSHEFGKDIIPRLLAAGSRIYGYKFRGYWGYTRTIEEYWQTNMDLLGDAPKIPLNQWGLRTNLEHRRIRDCPPWKSGPAAIIRNSLIYNGCIVEGRVENSILFPRVHVAKGAIVRDSILFFNNQIAADCRLEKVISDVNNNFASACMIGDEGPAAGKQVTVIGRKNSIPAKTVIASNCLLYPELQAGKIQGTIASGMVLQ
jgi:glucose-1-phosphate adenylyltransferase